MFETDLIIFIHSISFHGYVINKEGHSDVIKRSSSLCTNEVFHLPHHRTSIFGNSFHITSARLSHSLPDEVKNSSSLPILKMRLKIHLYANEFNLLDIYE